MLIGSGNETTLEGGKGYDTSRGGSRSKDTYVFNLGGGNGLVIDDHATIDSSRQSEIRFGAGIAQSDIAASQSGRDLLLRHVNGHDSIRGQGWLARQRQLSAVNSVACADGSSGNAGLLGQVSLSADYSSEAPTLAAFCWK